tara:strand:- start:2329 stop:2637 length:309 start_codon:yes stop_codon:yes gene_type:complete
MAQQTFGSIIKTVSATGTPEALGSGSVRGHSFTFVGMKAARTDNAGKIYIQPASGNDTAGIPLSPGDSITFTADSDDDYFTDAQFYIDVENAGDGVIAFYDK